jgi:phage/plasmid-like protein (TIGR03299 family)
MSKETLEAPNTLIGFTDKRGTAWHYRADLQGDRPNHFPGAVPTERALELLSYPIVEGEVSVTALTDDGVFNVVDPTSKAIVRTDTGLVLGIFKQGYKIHQPAEWVHDNVNLILDGGAQIGSVLVLKGGKVAALQAELEETREAAEGVKHRPFLTAATSADGSMATSYSVGTQVAICDNTLSIALANADMQVKIRHSSGSLARVGEIREKLGFIIEQAGDAFDEQVKRLTSQYVSDDVWFSFVEAYTNPKGSELEGRSATMAENKAAILNKLYNYDKRVAPWRGSAYGVLAAVNTAVAHEFTVKGTDRASRNALRTVTGEWDTIDAGTLRLLAKVS